MNETANPISPRVREKLQQISDAARELLGEAVPSPQEGYYLTSRVFGDKIHVHLMRDGKLVSSGFSRVNPNEPVCDKTMAQAFSYAAHMAYKHCQWKDEFDSPASPSTSPVTP